MLLIHAAGVMNVRIDFADVIEIARKCLEGHIKGNGHFNYR